MREGRLDGVSRHRDVTRQRARRWKAAAWQESAAEYHFANATIRPPVEGAAVVTIELGE
jgi:hypothetical protein